MKNKESRVGNMAVRDEIIKTLEENRGTYLSGEQLAKKLSVSRAAVWKAIRKLQEDGFAIEGVNNKGYKLAEDTDVLSVQGTAKYLDVECPVRLEVFRCINSTNLALRERTQEEEGLVLAAMEQTNGLGRLGTVVYVAGKYRNLFQYPVEAADCESGSDAAYDDRRCGSMRSNREIHGQETTDQMGQRHLYRFAQGMWYPDAGGIPDGKLRPGIRDRRNRNQSVYADRRIRQRTGEYRRFCPAGAKR